MRALPATRLRSIANGYKKKRLYAISKTPRATAIRNFVALCHRLFDSVSRFVETDCAAIFCKARWLIRQSNPDRSGRVCDEQRIRFPSRPHQTGSSDTRSNYPDYRAPASEL